MAVSKYMVEYLDSQGQKKTDIVLNDDPAKIESDYLLKGYTPLSIKKTVNFGFKRNTDLVTAFFSNLRNLLDAGVSINIALETLINNEHDPVFRSVLKDAKDAIDRGYSFNDGLKLHPEWFSVSLRSIVASGEQSGRFSATIQEAVFYLREEEKMRKSLMKDLAGPLGMLLFGIFMLFFNVFFSIPKLLRTEFFQSIMMNNKNIGFYLMKVTTLVMPVLFVFIVAGTMLFVYLYRKRQEDVEAFLVKVPLLNNIWFNREAYLTYFTCTKLLEVNIPLENIFEILMENTRLKQIKNGLEKSLKKLRMGQDIVDTLPLLDPIDRALMQGATNQKNMVEAFSIVSRKKMETYQQAIKKLPGYCKAFTYGVLIYLFFIIFVGVMLPYFQSIQTMMDKMQ